MEQKIPPPLLTYVICAAFSIICEYSLKTKYICKPKWQKEYNFRCLGKLKNDPIKTDKYAK